MWAISQVAERVSQFAAESLLALNFFLGALRPQSQSHICTIFEEALVARAEGIWTIALDVEWPRLSVELTEGQMRPRLIRTDFAARLQWDRSRHKLRLRLRYQACGQHSQWQRQTSPSTGGEKRWHALLAILDAKYFRSSHHRRIRGLDQVAARISGRRNSCSRTLSLGARFSN